MKSHFKILTFLVCLIFSNSCGEKLEKHSSIFAENTVDCMHLNQYKQYGQQFYEHIKYNMAYVKAENFLPLEHRQPFMVKFDSLKVLTENWDLPVLLNHYEAQNFISSYFKQAALDMDALLENVFSGAPSFPNAILQVQNLTQQKINSSSIPCSEKRSIVVYYSIVENMLVYLNEIYGEEINQVPGVNILVNDRSCSFWKRLGCFFRVFGKDFLTGFGIGINATESVVLDISLGIAGGMIGAAIGVIHGLIVAIDGAQCCPQEIDCRSVLGVSLEFNDCGSSARYTAWGFGSNVTSLGWVNTGGTPATSITPSSSPSLTITQSSPSTPVRTVVSSGCSNGSIGTSVVFTNNLNGLRDEVLGTGLFGPTRFFSTSVPLRYYISGFDPNRHEVVGWNVVGGTILQSDITFAVISWNTIEDEGDEYFGEVTAVIRNKCPNGQTKTHTLKVLVLPN